MDGWTLIRFPHIVAVAFFVGGQPVLAVAIAVLVATGSAMATHLELWHDHELEVKLALGALVGVLIGLHVVAPRRRALSMAVLVVSLAVVWLGVDLSH